jgi:Phage integrase, N-terminal SAM-like domain
MRGNITRRGKSSWRIKFDLAADSVTSERRYYVETVRGIKRDAQALLAKRLAEHGEGQLVQRTVLTVAEYARHWLATIAPAKASAKTLDRYGELIEKHIIPAIGAVELQKLEGSKIDMFYVTLCKSGRRDGTGGLSAQTVQHIHRLLSQILGSAVKAGKLRASPIGQVQTTPKVRRPDIQVLDDAELDVRTPQGTPSLHAGVACSLYWHATW